ncbi:hypothetical protein JCM3774_005268 [Rhodotorula dairenensis]
MSSVLPFHNPIIPTHKRNRSPPLTGSATNSLPGGSGSGGSGGIGLGVTTTVSDGAAQRALFGLGGGGSGSGAGAERDTAGKDWDGKLKRPWRRWSWCGAWRAKIRRPKKPTSTTATATGPGSRPSPGAKRLAMKNHLVACLGEFVGTTLFIFLALGATSVANLMVTSVTGTAAASGRGAAPNTSSLFYISCGAGLSLMVTTFTFARVSGAFFNPAVSLGMALTGALTPVRAILLVGVQLLGGICGAAMVAALTPGSRRFATTLAPAMSISRGLFLEMMLTAVLVLTILFLVAEKHKGTLLAPVGIGLALFVAELYGVYWTGGSLNPARSLGPAVISHSFPSYFWIYMLGPSLGAVLAAVFYKLLKWLEYETVFPSTPEPPRYTGGAPGVRGASYTGPFSGPGLSDLLTQEAPTLSTAAALRSGGASGLRNSQLQERFDRLEEIIEQLGGRDSLELSRTNTQELGSGDEGPRGRWGHPSGRANNGRENPMSPSNVSASVAEVEEEEKIEPVEGEAQLMNSLAQLRKYGGPGASSVGPGGLEGRKQQ